MAVKKEVDPTASAVIVKKPRAKKTPVKELVVEKKTIIKEEPEDLPEVEEKGVVYKLCPVCKEIKVKFIRENGWFWAACKACDSKTYMFKNEYMLNDAYDKGRFNKPKV